jgi:hypothetical protein
LFGPWPGFCLEVGVATGRDSGGVEEVVGGFALAASRSSRHFFFAPVTTGPEVEVEEEVGEEVEEEEAEVVADLAAFLADSSLIFFSQIFFSPGKE